MKITDLGMSVIHQRDDGTFWVDWKDALRLPTKEEGMATRKRVDQWNECTNCCRSTQETSGECLVCQALGDLMPDGDEYGQRDTEVMEEWNEQQKENYRDEIIKEYKEKQKDSEPYKPKDKENVGVDYTYSKNQVGVTKTVQIKEEFVEAGSMVLVNQASKIVMEGVRSVLKSSALDAEKQKLLMDILNTESGRAACICAAGILLPYLPKIKENVKLLQISQSMRLTGMSLLGNEVFDSILVPIFKTLTGKDEVDIGMLFQFANDPGSFLAEAENNKELNGMAKALKQMTSKFSGLVPQPVPEPAASNGKKEKVAG